MANEGQATFWTEVGGPEWVRNEARQDRMFAGIGAAVLGAAAPQPGERVLDVGCGFGTLAIDAAYAVAPGGDVLGVDIAAPMVERAIARAADVPSVAFTVDDAQTMASIEPPFDVVVSRFGVMFFDDPVAAFANIGRSAAPGARLAFACWQGFERNAWMLLPVTAAEPYLAQPWTPPPPHTPGPMAFGDPGYVRRLLTAAGWERVELRDLRPSIDVCSDDLDLGVAQMLGQSIGRTVWPQLADDDRPKAEAALRAELATHLEGDSVRYDAGVWIVTARWVGSPS